ncbi:MAG: phosphoribosylaminoimidazolesuccinocarboxamide synthase [Candidatus Omnitrophota bacterium]
MGIKTEKHEVVLETDLPLPLIARGKVRDIYAIDEDKLLLVTSDRISAFDVVMPTPIPYKGRVLNQISLFWFNKLKHVVSNPLITTDINNMGLGNKLLSDFGHILEGRSVLAYRAKPLPIECIVRGFLVGSGWKDYQKTGKVCGHVLPSGLKKCDWLPEPIFTPSTKAVVGHDVNISYAEAETLLGNDLAGQVRDISLRLYREAVEFAGTKGILIADTKFEFGLINDKVVLIDEVLTPDSSRFWPANSYQPGKEQLSLDKQYVRDYLESLDWRKTPPGPELPEEIAAKTSMIYRDIFKKLAGTEEIEFADNGQVMKGGL